ncbi:MAG: pyridoxine 5'-phosphate synthase [Hydrotalea sp.]|nr:pyridoxine 5'-phosphate synthase [Hydrotalea sp.]
MVALSVNINKVAWLRNSRDGDSPSPLAAMVEIIAAGADGITIHPRPDERHITTRDAVAIAAEWQAHKKNNIEFNIEGFPDDQYLSLIEQLQPSQATLVPDAPAQKTSDHGYFLSDKMAAMTATIKKIKSFGPIRVSLFVDADHGEADAAEIKAARDVGADRVELYTGPFAHAYAQANAVAQIYGAGDKPADKSASMAVEKMLANYVAAYQTALDCGLAVNAGHDLNLQNLPLFIKHLPNLAEVSIGHALIADALWFGFRATIKKYRQALQP